MSSNGKRTRRTFSEEFKRDAVNLIVSEGYSFRAAAEAVNVNENSLRNWHRKYAPEPEPCGPEASLQQVLEENKRLRKQLKRAELEREILKKATAYFAKESQ
ncbi:MULTISPECIES: transposase [Pirellulaceae]|uniref:Transposase n=2 Tax=Mariniblastus fucicola TaxID=980251 RepID=A0A5B9PDE7_9BACT|nr:MULTISPECIES: transposase [Pirellulaceae]QEG22285.1 Transposase [Mariniblastus fucicola]QEG22426.1 Transposase [Mariniblastus fucicola]QEG22780.1 Transposase [Mariniblastus fucicola]QEG22932.1 Transposase [Mariniblastus fucicola]